MWYKNLVNNNEFFQFLNKQRLFAKNRSQEDVFDRLLKLQYKSGCSFNQLPIEIKEYNEKGFSLYDCDGIIGTIALKSVIDDVLSKERYLQALVFKNLENPINLGFHLLTVTYRGYLCIALQSTTPVMSYGEVYEKLVGNNIIGFAIPTIDLPIIVDCSLGETSVRDIVNALETGTDSYNKNGVVNSEGNPFKNIEEVLKHGVIKSIGGYKGGVIALGIQCLMATLSGVIHKNKDDVLNTKGKNSLLLLLIKSNKDMESFAAKQLNELNEDRIYVPGRKV